MNEIDIGLTTEKGDLSNYMNNSEFDLIDMRAMRIVIRFPTDTETSRHFGTWGEDKPVQTEERQMIKSGP